MNRKKLCLLVCSFALAFAMHPYAPAQAKVNSAPATKPPASDPIGEVQALAINAGVPGKTPNWTEALAKYESGLREARIAHNRASEAAFLVAAGLIYRSTNEPSKALERFELAIPIYHEKGDKLGEAQAHKAAGNIFQNTGKAQKAQEHYEQALTLFRSVGNKRGEADILYNTGRTYLLTGQPLKAKEVLEQALPIYHDGGYKSMEAAVLSMMARAWLDTGHPIRARGMLQQSVPISHAVGDKTGEAVDLNGIGVTYLHELQPDSSQERVHDKVQLAYEPWQQAASIFHDIGNLGGEADLRFNMGCVCNDTGEFQKALEQWLPVSVYRASIGDRAGQASVLNFIGDAYQETDEPEKALAAYRQSNSLREQLREDLGAGPEARQAYLISVLDGYYKTIALLLDQKRIQEAFAVAQKTKARSLLDLLTSGRVDLSAVLTPEERKTA